MSDLNQTNTALERPLQRRGPLGLEQLAAAVARVRGADREELSIPLRRETRAKLEQLARAEGQATAHPVTTAELAAAVVEQFVATAPNG